MFRTTYAVLVLLINIVKCFDLPSNELFRLDIIHYNDFHARFEETSVPYTTCRTNDSACLGGFPRLYAEVTALLREKPLAVLLNAGDSFQGTYWYTLLKWNVTQRFMNLLPHDAHAIGNHEFDDSPAGLAPYLSHLRAPVIAANMDTSEEPSLDGLYKPYIIVERANKKIGIIGVTTTTTKDTSYTGKVKFGDPGEAAFREAAELTAQGVDLIVLLSHCGIDVDIYIARHYGENIDLIVGGHSHSLFWNGNVSPTGEMIRSPYPLTVQPTSTTGHKVLIVQASAYTKYLGNLSVLFYPNGEYHSWEGGPIVLDRSVAEDEEMKRLLAPIKEELDALTEEVVGESRLTLEDKVCHIEECIFGGLVCDALIERAKEKVSSRLPHVAFIQSGSIRQLIPKGNITRGMIINALPYSDRVNTFALQGRYIVEALEHGVNKRRYMQIAGLKLTYNVSTSVRIQGVSVNTGDKYVPLENERFYQVTTFAYVGRGRGGFHMVSDNLKKITDIGEQAEVFENYIRLHSPLRAAGSARITVLT